MFCWNDDRILKISVMPNNEHTLSTKIRSDTRISFWWSSCDKEPLPWKPIYSLAYGIFFKNPCFNANVTTWDVNEILQFVSEHKAQMESDAGNFNPGIGSREGKKKSWQN